MASGTIKCKNLTTYKKYTLSNCVAGNYYTRTAEVISGYRFMCWLQPASNGTVACGMYSTTPYSRSATFWCEIAGTYDIFALYISGD